MSLKFNTLIKSLAFAVLLGATVQSHAQEISAMQAPRVVSPEVNADKSVTFRVLSEKATEVSLNGSWMGFREILPLVKGEQGVWSVTTKPLPSSMYHYNFYIDGVAAIDPTNSQALRDGTRYASLLMVPGEEAEVSSSMIRRMAISLRFGTILQLWELTEECMSTPHRDTIMEKMLIRYFTFFMEPVVTKTHGHRLAELI